MAIDKVTCIVADGCMGWAIRVAKQMGISRAAFWPASVCTLASALSYQKLIDDGIINNNGEIIDECIHDYILLLCKSLIRSLK